MKKIHLVATAASLAVALALTGTGAATAAPAKAEVKPVHYEVGRTAHGATITLRNGAFTQNGRELTIRAADGRPVGQVPLTYQVNDIARPIVAKIAGNVATLIPARTAPGRPVTPVTRRVSLDHAKHTAAESFTPRDQQALSAFSNRSTIGSFTSAAVGAALGAGTGCIIGAVVAGAATLPIAMLLGGGPLAGCIAGAVLFAPAGAAAGLLFVGLPIVLFSAFQYFSTVTSPCTAKGAYCQDPARPKPEAKSSGPKKPAKRGSAAPA